MFVVIPTFLSLLFFLVQSTSTLASPAPLNATTLLSRDDLPTDPYQQRIPQTTLYLVFSGFRSPLSPFNPLQLIDIGFQAQSDIVDMMNFNRGRAEGGGKVPMPNLEYYSYHAGGPGGRGKGKAVFLRWNHRAVDGELTWLMLSKAIRGVVSFGWMTNFVLCKRISLVDDRLGVVAEGELVFG
ncbi:MAG: hypothetical protein Q9194_006817 [Teloschistes cf. exilis]